MDIADEELVALELEFGDNDEENRNINKSITNPETSSKCQKEIESSSLHKTQDMPKLEHLRVLRKYFGHENFRPFQWEIIHSILIKKKDNCAIMATGYGKSLCYQFPSVFTNGLSIVISPLISLMEDQVKSLEISNIPACFLGSAQLDKAQTREYLLSGTYRLVYMTPEYVCSDNGIYMLENIQKTNNIVLIAIDEAHCISKWGHDFRSAYRSLGKLRDILPNIPILAVTATATTNVQHDIMHSLKLRSPQMICTGFDRPNLYYKVMMKTKNKYEDLIRVLRNEKKVFNIENGSVIIYCLTKKVTEFIAEFLKINGLKAKSYHAGLSINKRKTVHEDFMKDEIKIIVATVAFGMGIDKPNVRCVIHYGASSDMESYYQEAGRAGRDGNPSLCVMFHSRADFRTHAFLREKSHMSASALTHKVSLNNIMRQFLSITECRRNFIISYFDKSYVPNSNTSNLCCDNCTQKTISLKDIRRDFDEYKYSSMKISIQSSDKNKSDDLFDDKFNEQEQSLLNILFDLRHKLAKERNIMPHTIASDVALHQLAARQPKSVKLLIHVDGMSEKKIEDFGSFFVNEILKFQLKNPQIIHKIAELMIKYPAPLSAQSNFNVMNPSQNISIDLFNSGKSLSDIATERKLVESTIMTHLCCGVRNNLIDVSKLIKPSHLNCIIKIIKSEPIKNDMSKLGTIKNVCPPMITFDEIKLSIAYLEIRNHMNSLHIPYLDNCALKTDDQIVSFHSTVVYPDGDIVDVSLGDFDLNSSYHSEDILKKEQKSNLDDLDFDIPNEILNEIESFENLLKKKNDIDSLLNEKKDIERNIIVLENDNIPSSSNTITILKPDKSIDNIVEKKIKKVVKKPKIFVSSDSDSDDCATELKRKLQKSPTDIAEMKNKMKLKMSKNSLFN